MKTAIIIGGATGIGFASAKIFLEHGYNILLASRNLENLQKARKKLSSVSHKNIIKLFAADIAKIEDVQNLFKFAKKTFSSIDIVVNSAATIYNENFIDFSYEKWQNLFDINVKGTVLCCAEAFKIMQRTGGSITNISSLGGIANTQKFQGFSSYTTSKFAITGLTESLAVEGKQYNIRVNAIAPGAVDTDMLKKAAPNLQTKTIPKHIAQDIYHLATSEHINGTILTINSNE